MTYAVTQLAIYPVKSMAGVARGQMALDRRGPAFDRRFIVTDPGGQFLTQRQFPRMCLVAAALGVGVLTLSAPSMPVLSVDSRRAAWRSRVVIWRDSVEACDMGDDAARWLSQYLGTEARLHYMPDDSIRQVDTDYGRVGDSVSFADGFPILLITEASLREFNRTLPEPIGAERFRPNIVIDGDEPYAEDRWRRLRIADIEFDVVKPCSRCVIPSIDPRTAQKQSYVVQALARTRRRGDAVYFGQNLIHRGTGTIAVGDVVAVLEQE